MASVHPWWSVEGGGDTNSDTVQLLFEDRGQMKDNTKICTNEEHALRSLVFESLQFNLT